MAEARAARIDLRGLTMSRTTLVCAGAALLYTAAFILYPYGHVGVFSFWAKDLYSIRPDFILDNYQRIVERPLYLTVIGNSLRIATMVTLVSAVMGYVLAMFLARYAGRWKNTLFILLLVPLWTSFLLRAYVWKIILGRNGLIGGFLGQFGVEPDQLGFLLYSDVSIVIALVYIFVPFVAIPVFAALEKIPPAYGEASADLGARPIRTFVHVTFPLTVPSLLAGCTIVFCLSFGDFITPALLGGSDNIMIANVIIGQFGAAFDWPFGSALAIVVLATVLVVVSAAAWVGNRVAGGR
ncbi:ABC transporter permease [Amorphus orientalis]|uniref:Spermidine/putrescine transport system permease protein n=1 Tax=Amorphus orientalis TaxID=649198 RepID=A0AAE3VSL4_9HYPH|nr:ABC transporter permease [Amorphus orientalis]MDQ0317435.1 spermidine/putrescine transport system permease protein [Amorphus orientalis]